MLSTTMFDTHAVLLSFPSPPKLFFLIMLGLYCKGSFSIVCVCVCVLPYAMARATVDVMNMNVGTACLY